MSRDFKPDTSGDTDGELVSLDGEFLLITLSMSIMKVLNQN